jgi:hypothetical protein
MEKVLSLKTGDTGIRKNNEFFHYTFVDSYKGLTNYLEQFGYFDIIEIYEHGTDAGTNEQEKINNFIDYLFEYKLLIPKKLKLSDKVISPLEEVRLKIRFGDLTNICRWYE